MATKKGSDQNKNTGQFVAGNKYRFKAGKSGNPKGRAVKAEILKEIDANLGSIPRETLFMILDQLQGGTVHFAKTTAIGAALPLVSVADIIKIAVYLDEQANGKAKIVSELSAAVIVLSEDADRV